MDNILNYLLMILRNNFEEYLIYTENYTQEELDEKFSINGQKVHDKIIFTVYGNLMNNEQVYDAFYTHLITLENELEYSLKYIVNFLAYRYILYCYGEDNEVVSFLNEENLINVVKEFKNNYDFAMELITKAFLGLRDSKKVNRNMFNCLNNNESYFINKWVFNDVDVIESSLNEELRDKICQMVDKMVENGLKYENAIDYFWQFFTRDFDPLGIIASYGNEDHPEFLKLEILSIMYSDVFEDVCNLDNPYDLEYKERFMIVIVILSVYMGIINIPCDNEIRRLFLQRFMDLRYDFERRKYNRCESYKNDRISLVKKINPSYAYDELIF